MPLFATIRTIRGYSHHTGLFAIRVFQTSHGLYYIKHHIDDYVLKYETNWQYDKGNLLNNLEFSAQLWVSRALWILSILLLRAGVMTYQNPQAPVSWGFFGGPTQEAFNVAIAMPILILL